MKQLLLGLIATFAFGTALAQSAPPEAATTPAAMPATTSAPVAQEPPAETPAVPAGAEDVFVAPGGTKPAPTVAVVDANPNISPTVMWIGAAALVGIAAAAGGGSSGGGNGNDECPAPGSDCPSSP